MNEKEILDLSNLSLVNGVDDDWLGRCRESSLHLNGILAVRVLGSGLLELDLAELGVGGVEGSLHGDVRCGGGGCLGVGNILLDLEEILDGGGSSLVC